MTYNVYFPIKANWKYLFYNF